MLANSDRKETGCRARRSGARGRMAGSLGAATLLAAALALAAPGGRAQRAARAAGVLDPSFGASGLRPGIISIAAGNGVPGEGRGVVIQPDGKIVVAGPMFVAGGDHDLGVWRFEPDGDLDPTFGDDGIVNLPLPDSQQAHAVALQPDGRIVVAGEGVVGISSVCVVARFTTDGMPDPTFHPPGGGHVTIGFEGSQANAAHGVAIQKDGKIVVAGYAISNHGPNFALARLTTDGFLDDSFDFDGQVITDFGAERLDVAYAVAIQKDGKIVAAGFTEADAPAARPQGGVAGGGPVPANFALARYLPDGRLDARFEGDGRVITDFSPAGADRARGLAIQKDGKIVAAGETAEEFGSDFAVARYRTNGRLDPSFDGDGKVITDFGPGFAGAAALAAQKDGKIVAVGRAPNGANLDIALARYLKNGRLDPRFGWTAGGTPGRLLTHAGGNDQAGAVALQWDGRIVAAGSTSLPALVVARYLGR